MKRIVLILLCILQLQFLFSQSENEWYLKVDRSGYINKNGNVLKLPEGNVSFLSKFNNGFAEITIEELDREIEFNGKVYKTYKFYKFLINTDGKIVIDFQNLGVEEIGPFSEGLFRATKKEGKIGFINIKGEWVIEPKYKHATTFVDNRCTVQLENGQWLLIDKNEKIIYNNINKLFSFDSLSEDLSFSVKIVKDKNKEIVKLGYVDKNGEIVIPFQYEKAKQFSEGLALVSKSRKGSFYFINKKGNRVEQLPKASFYISFSDGLAVIQQKGKVGYINHNGEIVISCIYDYATPFIDGYAAVTLKEPKLFNNPDMINESLLDGSGTGMYIIINKKGDQVTDTFYYGTPVLKPGGVAYVEIEDGDDSVFSALIDLDKGGKIFDREDRSVAKPI